MQIIENQAMLLPPKAGSDVMQCAVDDTVETLVGSAALQGAQMLEIGSQLDIVEVIETHLRREQRAAAPPSDVQLGIALAHPLCQTIDLLRLRVAAHETEAGNLLLLPRKHAIDGLAVEHFPTLAPKVRRVASRATAGTAREVDGQRHLVGQLLEHYVGINVV